MFNKVIVYGLASIERAFRPIAYWAVDHEEPITESNLQYHADAMMQKHPDVELVYAIPNREGLRDDYLETIRKPTIENCICFKDILERQGTRIYL